MHIAKKLLTVEGDVEDVVCLDEIDVLIHQLDAILVIQKCAVGLVLAAETLARLLFNMLQGRLFLVNKLHRVLLLRLVHASVHPDRYLKNT